MKLFRAPGVPISGKINQSFYGCCHIEYAVYSPFVSCAEHTNTEVDERFLACIPERRALSKPVVRDESFVWSCHAVSIGADSET